MDPFTHTILALICIGVAYFVGYWNASKRSEEVMFALFAKLEEEGKLVYNAATGELNGQGKKK